MRQFGEIPAPLAAANTPQVLSTSGLGGGGAGVQTPDSGNFGDINVFAGPTVASSGSIVLQFTDTPPTMFISGEEAFGTVTQAHDDILMTLTISWTGATMISRWKFYRLHYEWFDSTKAN